MSRISVRERRRHDRNDRGWLAVRAAVGALLVFLALGVDSIHGHAVESENHGSDSVFATSEGAPGPIHGHAEADRLDCQLCKLSRRGEFEHGAPTSSSVVMFSADGPKVRVLDLVSAPRAPSLAGPSPRAPPTFSV